MESVFDKGLIDYQKELAAFKGTPEQQAAMVAKMSQAKKVQLFKTIEAIKDVNSKRDILKWFPDKGKLSRDKYPKHMEFIKAGAKYKERLFIAANRCLTSRTKVETPNGEVEIGKLYEEGKPFEVYAWDGEKVVTATAEAPFEKPLSAECVRLNMADGRWVECSLDHRILTSSGWRSAAEIVCFSSLSEVQSSYSDYEECLAISQVLLRSRALSTCLRRLNERASRCQPEFWCVPYKSGQSAVSLLLSAAYHLLTKLELCLSGLHLSELHSIRTALDSQVGCQVYRRFYDGQLPSAQEICQSLTQLLNDVLPLLPALSREDGQACTNTDTRREYELLLSSSGVYPHLAARLVEFLSSCDDTSVPPLSGLIEASRQPSIAEDLPLPSGALYRPHTLAAWKSKLASLGFDEANRTRQLSASEHQTSLKSLDDSPQWQSSDPQCLYPLDTSFVASNYITTYQSIGVKSVYDFTVPVHHNYLSGGVIHHNTGKSAVAGIEVACHLTGMYPHWWEGKKFTKPVRVWVSSKTSSMTRDFIQRYLMGPWGHFGTGFIPGECFSEKDWTPKRGIPEAVDVARIHGMFGESEVMFKSYDQGWQSYQGTAQDVIWNDEECDELVHNECLTRLMTTEGIYILTFTPLQGMTKVVRGYLGDSLKIDNTSKYTYVVNCTWDDVPHLSEEEKKHQWERTPPYLRDAKAKGIPSVGSGSIYPIPDDDIKIAPFKIPEWWPKCFAMDVGWNRTAALWGALDRESDTLYIYSEYYRGMAEPSVHADAIKARGAWIPGVIDPASRGRAQADGSKLFQIYTDFGLDIEKSKNAVEAGIYEVWQRISTGKIKVFSNLQNFFTELRMYQRDVNGKIVKENDHLMDCLKYLILSGIYRATTRREIRSEESGAIHGFVPVDKVCGY